MKKNIILLTLIAISLITACGAKKKNLPETLPSPAANTASDAFSGEEMDPAEYISAKDPTVPIPVEETSNAIDKDADDYVAGTIEGDTYQNEWLGLTFQCPENASFLSEDDGEYEMYCQNDDHSVAVFVTISDLPKDVVFFQQYLTALKRKMTESQETNYMVLDDSNEATVGANTYHAVIFASEKDGQMLYQTYFIRIMGNKVANIVITYSDDNVEKAQEMIDLFS